jgi:mono/diheme cytochrome c family protein
MIVAHLARAIAIAVTLLVLTGGAATAGGAVANGAKTASATRGAYLATAADCTACHTAPGGAPFAGGLPIASPVGVIFATNITPSRTAGIGTYSEAQFARALREGVRKDGANLYPAMPYTSYRLLSDADVQDLYSYFRQGVPPVNVAPRHTSLPFPMNIRASMMAWNLLFSSSRRFAPDPRRPADWNRGAYLITGLAHCGACHTPRGFLMQELSAKTFAGGAVGPWFAPNITSDPASGIGTWTQADIVQYLHTGALPAKARAAGGMGEAVEHSLQFLTPADLAAIATYLRTIPAVHDKADRQSRFTYGTEGSALGTVRGKSPVTSGPVPSPTGAALFLGNCASCHSPEGAGGKDDYYPRLIGNSDTGAGNPTNLIATILYGVDRKTPSGQAYMPGFGGRRTDFDQLDDNEIALLSNYVLKQFGRADRTVSARDVAISRRGGPSSPLVLLARIAIAGGAIVMLALLLLLVAKATPWLKQPRTRRPYSS